MSTSALDAAALAHLSGVTEGLPVVTAAPHPELERLLNIEAERGSIPAAEYRVAELAMSRSKRQIQRDLAKLRDSERSAYGRSGFELTEHHKQVIVACQGNVNMAHSKLLEAGEDLPGYHTFWAAWHELPMGIQAYARRGAEGMAEMQIYLRYEAPERNAVWQADHFELPVDVIADGHTTTLVKPWLTLFVDDKTRKVMAWAITAIPGQRADAEVVCATLAAAIQVRLEHGVEVGGVPRVVRWDNDLSFVAGMVTQFGSSVGFECHAVPPYSGHMKGKIERLGRTVQEQFCVLQPGYTHGPRTYTQRDLFRDTTPLTAEILRGRIDQWFAEYDTRVHSSLGTAPIEAWKADATPLRKVAADKLRSALLVDKAKRKVIKRKGVSFKHPATKSRKQMFWASGPLMAKTNQTVEVRYAINDDSFIEIFQGGKWLCTAWPSERLTDTQRSAVRQERFDQYYEAKDLHERATRLRVGADAVAGETDATPAVASMPADDPLAPSVDDLFDMLRLIDEAEDGVGA
jgi:putative transposase